MRTIPRDKYLQQLVKKTGNGQVKIVTGARRTGKSFLLREIFTKYLISTGVEPDHIIYLPLDASRYASLKIGDNLQNYLDEQIKRPGYFYVILDEIQEVPDFVPLLNSFLYLDNVDIYVTGSNSHLLSSDIVTEFRGRGDVIHMHPLSFSEFAGAFEGSKYEAWDQYSLYGGLPFILTLDTPAEKSQYLKDLFSETYIRDIIERHHVRDAGTIDSLLDILSSSIGSLTNPFKLANTFHSEKHLDIDDKTIYNYINYLEDAFLIRKAQRYDIRGNKYINSPYKYYFSDLGLRNARLNFRQLDQGHIMENIIYNELVYRGYNVDVGVVPVYSKDGNGKTKLVNYEVDFVVNLGSERYYIQSATHLATEEKVAQEQKSLVHIRDSFKKIIIVMDDVRPRRDERGIVTMGLYHFLLGEGLEE